MNKKLPHINLKNHYQFITFRTNASVDDYVKNLQNENLDTKIKQYKIDKHLDNSPKGAYFFKENIEILKNIILEKNNDFYNIEIFCIMPNHVHLLIKQNIDLDKIMKFIKGKSAVVFNRLLSKSGKFWLGGYYDKVIRDEKHFTQVFEYIENNPLKAGLEDSDARIYNKYSLE